MEHDDPAIDLHRHDVLGQGLGDIEVGEHGTEQEGGGDDHHDHGALPGRSHEDVQDVLGTVHLVKADGGEQDQKGPDTGRASLGVAHPV